MGVKDEPVAFYLIGHGPLRQPRLIELQHRRILRYWYALAERDRVAYSEPDLFIDLNTPRLGTADPIAEKLPALTSLVRAVEEKQYSTVFIDIDEGTTFKSGEYAFVRYGLRDAGAKVLSAFYDTEDVLKWKLNEMYGQDARLLDIDDPSDVVGFFPALASSIASTALRYEIQSFGKKSEEIDRIYSRLHELREMNIYAANRYPFVEERLHDEWARAARRREEEDRSL